MDDLALIRREHVHRAVDESPVADPAEPTDGDYLVLRGNASYPVQAVVDRACELVGVLPDEETELTPRDCALLLRGLGFEVTGEALPPLRYTSAVTVGMEHSRATWALAARERLLEVAASYGASIDYRELADYVQRRSLVRSGGNPSSWVGDVLGRVASDCAERREPLLTALVVDARGQVGNSYATALLSLRGEEPTDIDDQAAHERLDCHRHFGAELPQDGGVPVQLARSTRPPRAAGPRPATRTALTTRRAAGASGARSQGNRSVTGTRKSAEESVASSTQGGAATCPVHFTVIPPSGVCDFCE